MGQRLADAIKGQFCASRDTFYGLPLWKVFSTEAYKQFIRCEDTIYEYETTSLFNSWVTILGGLELICPFSASSPYVYNKKY